MLAPLVVIRIPIQGTRTRIKHVSLMQMTPKEIMRHHARIFLTWSISDIVLAMDY